MIYDTCHHPGGSWDFQLKGNLCLVVARVGVGFVFVKRREDCGNGKTGCCSCGVWVGLGWLGWVVSFRMNE